MSNIDKQAVQAVADLKAGYTLGHADVAILNELARIALASLEAESVAFINGAREPVLYGAHIGIAIATQLYTAPPAPVSDSLLSELLDIAKRAAYEADECAHAEFSDDSMEHSAAIADWERRAAMLQGAEQPQSAQQNIPENIPTLKDAVIAVRNSGIAIDGEKILAECDALNSPVIADGWKLVPVNATRAMFDAAARVEEDGYDAMHKAMLAAAPPQEVK